MIVQDLNELKVPCRETTLEECQKLDIFTLLDNEVTKHDPPGLGLAANQIGLGIRACTIHPKDKTKYEITHMINPVLSDFLLPIVSQSEGCLSIPGVRLNTTRFEQCTCTWIDFDEGKEVTAVFFGLPAIIVQHEVDHLNGITILDRAIKATDKPGRNDPCPCGSGKKYKKCCIK